MQLSFRDIDSADIPHLDRMMANAFDRDFQQHAAPGQVQTHHYEQGDFFRKWPFGCIDQVAYKIVINETIVGAIIVWMFARNESVLGLLFVDPRYQNYGIGVQAWRFIEERFPEVTRWTLATPEWSVKNHYFYEQRCGFSKIGSDGDHRMYAKERLRG